ncbi:MAG: DUF938 domain-containing protein [Pseudomonadota bacterium]
MNDHRPHAPAAERNKDAILSVLTNEFAERTRVLEIGSGTGQHAIHFAAGLPWLVWQPSDRAENLPGIRAWTSDYPAENLLPGLVLDVNSPPDFADRFDAAFSANTAHIMSLGEVRRMFALVDAALDEEACFCLYGPFKIAGEFTSDSNQQFDASLRAQDASMGIRDIDALDRFAAEGGFVRSIMHSMPANNFLAVWRRPG